MPQSRHSNNRREEALTPEGFFTLQGMPQSLRTLGLT